MQKSIFFLVLLFICSASFSQNLVSLKGKIINSETQLPIESATVYLSVSKDSTLVDYTITDKNGLFDLKIKKTKTPTFLKVTIVGYNDFKKSIESITSDIDFKQVLIVESSKLLGEVVVKSEAPPIRIKKDTLEFNAGSFKVRPDANVETLLKQLPGVEVGTDGKITVNGKEVNQILVNGKPFFDKDGKIALQSLPSDLIKKVQISDTKTKKEELSGKNASSNNTSINLTIDKDKNKGFFGKFMGGYGTNDRYESSGLINYFKNKRKISVLISSNNINSTGFSMDEIFDNMGGGRNSFYYNDNGSFGIGNMRFGGGKGITQSNMFGVNYTDELFKNFENSGSYFFTNTSSNNTNKTKQLNFLPSGNFTTESDSETVEDRFGNNIKLELEYKIDSTTIITISPKFVKSNNKYTNDSFEKSLDTNNQLLNESTSKTFTESDNNNFSNSLNFNKSFKRKGRNFNFLFENDNTKESVSDFNKSETVFYQSGSPDDNRYQLKENKNSKNLYKSEIEYNEPIKDSISLKLKVELYSQKTSEIRKTNDFDPNTQLYIFENALLTNEMISKTETITPKVGFSINKKNYSFDLDAGTALTQFKNDAYYLGNKTFLNKSYALPDASVSLNYRFTKTKSIWTSYNYNTNFPTANQILPLENFSNPLNTYIGNPDLNPDKIHNFYFSFRDFKTATKSGYSIYFGGNYYESQIASSSIFDSNRKRTTTYKNVSGSYSSWFGSSWNKTIKKDAHTYKFGLGLNGNLGLSKGFSNDIMFESSSLRLTPRVNFTYEYGELFTINPSYNFSYNNTKYTNYIISSAKNTLYKFNLQITNYWPKNWVFGNDFGYTYNSNITDGFKKDFYLWNSSLSYSFFDKKIMAKIKVYDLLNQNQSSTRTISATSIRDEENIVLKRYAMFSLTYKIDKFAGKEKPSRGTRMNFN
jgi:hypothetical protein